jgi:hypothetical protein
MVKRHEGALYIFSVAMRPGSTTVQFDVADSGRLGGEVEVIGENRRLALRSGRFEDGFGPYQVHLYRVRGRPEPERAEPITTGKPRRRPVRRPAPAEKAPEPSAAEVEGARLLKEAETAFIDGDLDRAREIFRKLVEGHAGTESARKAKEYLEMLD